MFIDETVVTIKAGDGGNGCYAYERVKYKPRGKPNGGCGGRGGHVYFKGSTHIHTLQDVSYHHTYKAQRGDHGKGSNKDGRNGKDIVIPIPLGTIVIDDKTGQILYDCVEAGKKVLIARGGRKGRGNAALVTQKNPHPEHAEFGKPGENKTVRLVLKVLADVGLVGRPNAGKSTFLSVVSHAHPKIAPYPFTTLEPHLGIVRNNDPDGNSFVIADIPGLIENSHKGKGLGIRFLKHIERTKILAIMVEATHPEPEKEAQILIDELHHYSSSLTEKPKCFILTKVDLVEDSLPHIEGWHMLSSVSGDGIQEILDVFRKLLEKV